MENIRIQITELIEGVISHDVIEQKHIEDILHWIETSEEIFRIEKPATPLKHLVCYSVLIDPEEKKILLFDHKKALLMLPSGGHVNKNEMPLDCAKRELMEELGIEAKPLFSENETPLFVTVVETVGNTPGHIDVDLWYVFKGDSNEKINDDTEEFKREFDGHYWMTFDEILATPLEKFDPNMHRFVEKLEASM